MLIWDSVRMVGWEARLTGRLMFARAWHVRLRRGIIEPMPQMLNNSRDCPPILSLTL